MNVPEIPLQFGFPVHVKMPRVFRYMDPQYVDLFFSTGALRLSSLTRFRGYPDEVRGDPSEGKGFFSTKGPNNVTYNVATVMGEGGYVFCTSLEDSTDIATQFGVTSAFAINDPMQFTAAVLRSIPGGAAAHLGFCNYQAQRVVENVNDNITGKEMLNAEGVMELSAQSLGAMFQATAGSGIELMFLKHKKYQSQAEFRFIWAVNTQFTQMQEFLDISCKEAVQYCHRVDSLGEA
jgi:hypothetical protein